MSEDSTAEADSGYPNPPDLLRFDKRIRVSLSGRTAYSLIDEGLVSVNGRQAKPSEGVTAGLSVNVTIPPPETIELAPEADSPGVRDRLAKRRMLRI